MLSLAGALVALAPAPASALGISLPGSATLSGLVPGQTATATGLGVTVSGVVLPWSLSVQAESSATPGHMRAAATGCSSSETYLQSPLHATASAVLGTTTIRAPSFDLGSSSVLVAQGTVADVVTMGYSQPVATTEALQTGCSYSITLTFTVS